MDQGKYICKNKEQYDSRFTKNNKMDIIRQELDKLSFYRNKRVSDVSFF